MRGAHVTWEFVPFETADLSGSLVVVGLPSVGNVGPTAARFLAEQLPMRLLGGFQSEALPPVGVVRRGIVTSPYQAWMADEVCGPDGQCDRLVVVNGDVALPPTQLVPLAAYLAEWAKERGAKLLVSLDGFPAEEQGAPAEGLAAVANRAGADAASRLSATLVQEAVLSGFSAALLVRANRESLPAVALFARVSQKQGDAEAAVELLRCVDPLVPRIPLAPEELSKRAAALAHRMRQEREQQERTARALAERGHQGYA